MRDEAEVFVKRLKKLGIEVALGANYPWIYLDTVNGKRVREKHMSEHGFVVGYLSIRTGNFSFSYIKEMFNLIRKYV